MANNRPTQHKEKTQYKPSTMPGFIVSCYLVLMFSFFPLFLTNQYGSARTDKYYFYTVMSVVMIAAVVVTTLMDYAEEKRIHKASLRFMPISVTDAAFLCFYGFAAISTLISSDPKAAFLGLIYNDAGANVGGRNNGLLLLTVYLLVYLCITRKYVFKDYVIAIYLVFSSAVSLLAIVNYFFIDILGIYTGYLDLWSLFAGEENKPNAVLNFGSTLGNKNLIASFMCLFLPIAVMSFVLIDKRWMKILSGIAVGFAYGGLLCSDSSSGILGLAVILAVMAIFSARRYVTLKRYLLAMVILFASGKLVRLFSYIMGDRSKGFEFIQNYLLYSRTMYAVIAVFAVLFLIMQIFEKNLEPHYPKKAIVITLIVLMIGGFTAVIGAFVYYSFINTEAELSDNLSGLLRFSERWGTHRGFYWIKSVDEFKDFSFIQKLFGTGPDTAYLTMEPYFSEMTARFNESSTDCVHNEYLNYLICQGVMGLISYLVLLGAVTVRAIRRSKNNPVILIFLSAVICYAVQSVVNLYQPITTPTFFLFLSITEALNRQTPVGEV